MHKKVLITGGGTGIGEEIAKMFYNNNYEVYIIGRRIENLQNVANNTNNLIKYFKCDISCEEDIDKVFNELDNIDILVNCAGIISSEEESPMYNKIELDSIIDINLKGTISICLRMVEKWKQNKIKGNIINIGSIAAQKGSKYFPIYASSKAGIVSFTKSIAARYGTDKIRCNVISPGVIKTPMSYVETPDFDDYIQEIESKTPLHRLGKPKDIANVVLFLASEYSEFITGQEIIVDGGYTLSQE